MFGIGSVISAVLGFFNKGFDYLNKKQDVALEKYKVDGSYDETHIKTLGMVAAARAADVVDRWGRRLFIYPTGVYYALTLYDSTFREVLPAWATWRTLELPADFKWVMMSVVGYLLVQTVRGRPSAS